MLRSQGSHSFQAAAKRGLRLVGKAGNQIQADVLETRLTRLAHQLAGVVGRVQTAHRAQLPVVKSLRADAQPVHPHAAQGAQQSQVCRPGSGFQGEL